MTGAGAEVHEPVRRRHGFAVVLDHDQGVADVAQVAQGVQQFDVVPLMQPDGGFVENVEHTGEFRSDLGGQADALGFAAGQGGPLAAERQVIQTHVDQKIQSAGDLLEQFRGDDPAIAGQLQSSEKIPGLPDGHFGDLDDGVAANLNGQHLGLQAPSIAGVAGPGGEEPAVILLCIFRLGLLVAPHQGVEQSLVRRRV